MGRDREENTTPSLEGDWDKLRKRLLQLAAGSYKAVPIIREETKIMAQEQAADAAVRTGFMRDNIEARDIPDGAESESKAGYSGFVEYGTRKMRAQPFFRPSMTHRWIIIQKRVAGEMKK